MILASDGAPAFVVQMIGPDAGAVDLRYTLSLTGEAGTELK
jgi:hypothetical protein